MKKQVNLYHPSCYPERQKASLGQFLIVSFVCISLSLLAYFITHQKTQSLNAQLALQKTTLSNKTQLLSELSIELQKKRAPEEKVRLHKALQDELVAKQRLIASIAGIDVQDLVSFSTLMKGLSEANMPNLSINHFSMVKGVLNITGEAKKSDSVPLWLANMQVTEELSDIAFKALSIEEVEGYFTFKLTNSDIKEKTNE